MLANLCEAPCSLTMILFHTSSSGTPSANSYSAARLRLHVSASPAPRGMIDAGKSSSDSAILWIELVPRMTSRRTLEYTLSSSEWAGRSPLSVTRSTTSGRPIAVNSASLVCTMIKRCSTSATVEARDLTVFEPPGDFVCLIKC